MPRAWEAPRRWEGQPAVECALVLAGRSSCGGCLSAWLTPRTNSCYGLLCLLAVMTGPVAWPSPWSHYLRNLDGCQAVDGSSLGRDNSGASCRVCYADLSGCSSSTSVVSVLVTLAFWMAWFVPTFCCCHGWAKTDACLVFPLKTTAVTGWQREGKDPSRQPETEMRLLMIAP